MKKTITIAANNYSHFQEILETNLFHKLKEDYNLNFLVFNNEKYKSFETKLSIFGNIYHSNYFNKKKIVFSIKKKINLFCYFTNEILFNKKKNNLKKENLIERTLCVDAPNLINLFKILYNLKILFPIFHVLNKINKTFILSHNKIIEDSELVFLLWKIYDPTSFCDDLIRISKKKNIKLLASQVNWDGIPSRTMLEKPKFLGVIGEQSFQFAFRDYDYSPNRLLPLGSFKFDKYRNNEIDKLEAKKKLNLPLDKKIIAFLPSGEEFDELYILEKLNEFIKNELFDNKICFYFKGYRGGKKETLINHLEKEYKASIENYKNNLENIIFWEPDVLNIEKKDYYKNLFKSIDGVVSNYSTLSVEAAFHGIPSIGFNYNPKKYGLYSGDNWHFECYWNHLYVLRNYPLVNSFEVNNREEILPKLKKLIRCLDDKKIKNDFYSIARNIVYDFSAEQAHLNHIKMIINNVNRERSELIFKD